MLINSFIWLAVIVLVLAAPVAAEPFWYGVDGPVPLMVSAGEGTQAIAVNLEDNREDYVT